MIARRHKTDSGFTLIEVVLAIALSAVLLSLLLLAVDQYLVNVQSSRATVEHAQVTRGVLRMIADDLRNAAFHYQQDISTVEQLAAVAAEENFDPDSVDEQPPDDDLAIEPAPKPPLGVSGDLTTLQIDVARTRRDAIAQPEEIAGDVAPILFQAAPIASGISTVRYSIAPQGGLVRQEVSRDVATFEQQQGATASWDAAYRVVADEVTAIQFRYNNGDQVVETWDLEEQEGVNPTAIEVWVTLRQPTDRFANRPQESAPTRTYRLSVSMPLIDGEVAAADTVGVGGDANGGTANETGDSGGSSTR